MKKFPAVSLSLISIGLALSASALADDPATPPAPPANAPTSPGDGEQPAPPPPQRRGHMRQGYVLEDLTAKLNLTADQQKSVGAIIANSHSQAKAVQGDDSLSKEDRHAKMHDIMTAAHDQIRAALTPDQQKIFDTLRAGGGKPKSPDNN